MRPVRSQQASKALVPRCDFNRQRSSKSFLTNKSSASVRLTSGPSMAQQSAKACQPRRLHTRSSSRQGPQTSRFAAAQSTDAASCTTSASLSMQKAPLTLTMHLALPKTASRPRQ